MGQILFRQSGFRLALEYLEQGMAQQEVPREIKIWKAICLVQQCRYLEALHIFDGIEREHPLYPLARLNKILCFWFQGNRRKVQEYVEDLFELGLSRDTGAVVGMLRDSLKKRHKPSGVVLGEEGMALLLDIVMRALDLKEKERALSLIRCLGEECLNKNALAIGELFYRYGYLDVAEQYLSMYLEKNPECAAACYTLAEVKRCMGLDIEAESLYRRALSRDPSQPRHYIGLIRLYENMRRKILRQAVEIYPDAPVLRRLLEEAAAET